MLLLSSSDPPPTLTQVLILRGESKLRTLIQFSPTQDETFQTQFMPNQD